jgi:ornithine carbamoyltransferase
MKCFRQASQTCKHGRGAQIRTFVSRSPPRHLLSIADLTPNELRQLIQSARTFKSLRYTVQDKPGVAVYESLKQQTVAMMFNKRSTRTRVSTEAAVKLLGGHPMFLGKDDIQLGVNEALSDTSKVISSMVACMVARVGPHSDIEELAKHSSVPVINALSDKFHPLQTIADFATMRSAFPGDSAILLTRELDSEPTERFKIAWVGDANNVLFDLAIGAVKLGTDIAVATPKGYEIPDDMRNTIQAAATDVKHPGTLFETNVPEEAIKDAHIIVTDTWVSMGQEEEKAKRLKDFEGFQVTPDLIKRGGARENWKFMHCLPRHPEEVSDEVFYDEKRSLVFKEAENRLYSILAVLSAFVARKGEIHGDVSRPLVRQNRQDVPIRHIHLP